MSRGGYAARASLVPGRNRSPEGGVQTGMRNFIILSCSLLLTAAGLRAADPFAGSWKLNVEKSRTTMTNPPPPPKSLVVVYAPDGDKTKVTSQVTLPDGTVRAMEHIVYYDGKDHPRFTGAREGDTLTSTRIDEFTEESVQKKDGKAVVTTRRVVSADGKTMTATAKSTGPAGEPVETVSVYDKL